MADQVTLRELLQDPIYKLWFKKIPKLKVHTASPPWYVYGQSTLGGRWRRKEFETYPQAYNFVARHLKRYHDMAITCKPQAFAPPIITSQGKKRYWRSNLELTSTHQWCPYCRRPTVFGYFSKHHAIPARIPCVPYELRCTICGVRKSFVKTYQGGT